MRDFDAVHVSTFLRSLLPGFILILFSALTFSLITPQQVAHAATITVNSISDADDSLPNDGICSFMSGACSLRAAIETANGTGNPGADTITFDSTVFSVARTITLGSDLPVISGDTTITGREFAHD